MNPRSGDVLSYLEELCAAMLAHDAAAIDRLLRDPLSRTLPRRVREEAHVFAALPAESCRAPMLALQFLNQTQKLIAVTSRGTSATPVNDPDQLTLPWAANDG